MEKTGKQITENRILIRFIKFLDVLAVTAIFAFVWMRFYNKHVYLQPFYSKGNAVVILLYAIFYYALAHLYQGFYIHICKISELAFAQILAAILSNFFLYMISILLIRHLPNVIPMFLCLILDVIVIVVWCHLSHQWYFRRYARKETIIIYDELEGVENLITDNGLDKRYKVLGVVNVKEIGEKYLKEKMSQIQIAFLCGIHSHERNQIIKYCVENNIKAYVIPRIGDVLMAGAEKLHLMHLPMLLVGRYDPKPEYLFLKRFFDIFISSIALVVLSPLMIVLTILIRRDGGTAFYRQVRLTKGGRAFEVLKFRSMRMDAEKDGVARLSTGENDPRITKIGRFIRSCRMDELPQLINILKGDMSIVGPRPERPEIAEQYEKILPEFKLRLQCKCGLTGYAQVYGKYNSTPYDKLLMDLMYIAKPSIAEDIKICFATLKILFMKESTEGVTEGATTAMEKKM